MRASSFDRGPAGSPDPLVSIAGPTALVAVHRAPAAVSRPRGDLARQVWDAVRDVGWSLLAGMRPRRRRA